jgi:hypothetical protein
MRTRSSPRDHIEIGFAYCIANNWGNLFLFSEMNMGTTSKVFPNMVQSGKRVVAMGGSLAVTVRTQRDYIFPT